MSEQHGDHDSSKRVLNGTEWKVQSTPTPEGTKPHAASTACHARRPPPVLQREFTKTARKLGCGSAEDWNGTKWKFGSRRAPEGAKRSELEGVSCSSTTACIATGQYELGRKVRSWLSPGLRHRMGDSDRTEQRQTRERGRRECVVLVGKRMYRHGRGRKWTAPSDAVRMIEQEI